MAQRPNESAAEWRARLKRKLCTSLTMSVRRATYAEWELSMLAAVDEAAPETKVKRIVYRKKASKR